MTIWLEIHCDKGIKHNNNCSNITHEYGMALGNNPTDAYKEAARLARKMGWHFIFGKWFCPSCWPKRNDK